MLRALLLTALALASACGEAPETPSRQGPARRVVSLSPAITATLVALGWSDRVVGRTPWCAGVDAVPVVGSLAEIDLERLSNLRPDLVLVQRTLSGPPPGLAEAAASRGWRVEALPCQSLDEVVGLASAVERSVGEPSPRGTGEDAWRAALAPLPAAAGHSPAVLLLAADPPMAFGTDAYLAEAWERWGGRALPRSSGHPPLSLEDLFSLSPRTVLLAGGCAGGEALRGACADRGVGFACVDDARLLRPGPELREALMAWRARLEAGQP